MVAACAGAMHLPQAARAQDPVTGDGGGTASEASLANAAQNPLATSISLPLQFNANFGLGPDDETQGILNIQPVIPADLGAIGLDGWNLINRFIFPLVDQPDLGSGNGDTFGLGDSLYSAFFSPPTIGDWVVGVGPVFQIPTSTDARLGNRQWGIGPTAVAVYSSQPVIAGALINNIWGFERGGMEGQNVMTLQPFVNYNFPDGWYVTTSPIITANWNADSDDVWTVPVGGGVGRVFTIGSQAVNAQLAAYYNAVRPDNGADWQLRFQFTFLFPE